MQRLSNKVAVITGGAGGIGLATAKRFLSEGAKVVIADVNADWLEKATKELKSQDLGSVVADVSKASDVKKMIATAVDSFGGVDVLFDNAGIEGKVSPLAETADEDFDRVLSVNLRGSFLAIKEVVPVMKARGGGSIIMTSSVAGLKGFSGLGPYVASKHGVMGLMRSAAIELGPLNIRVNSINPGPVDNRMMRSIEKQFNPEDPASVIAGFEGQIPLKRYATNEDVANLALFLVSEEAKYLNGQAFVVDGGFTA